MGGKEQAALTQWSCEETSREEREKEWLLTSLQWLVCRLSQVHWNVISDSGSGPAWLVQHSYRATFGLHKHCHMHEYRQEMKKEKHFLINKKETQSGLACGLWQVYCTLGLSLLLARCHSTGFTEANEQTRRQCENEWSHRGLILMLGCRGRSYTFTLGVTNCLAETFFKNRHTQLKQVTASAYTCDLFNSNLTCWPWGNNLTAKNIMWNSLLTRCDIQLKSKGACS